LVDCPHRCGFTFVDASKEGLLVGLGGGFAGGGGTYCGFEEVHMIILDGGIVRTVTSGRNRKGMMY